MNLSVKQQSIDFILQSTACDPNNQPCLQTLRGAVESYVEPSLLRHIANLCRSTGGLVYLTKNGGGDLVVMDIKAFTHREKMLKLTEFCLPPFMTVQAFPVKIVGTEKFDHGGKTNENQKNNRYGNNRMFFIQRPGSG